MVRFKGKDLRGFAGSAICFNSKMVLNQNGGHLVSLHRLLLRAVLLQYPFVSTQYSYHRQTQFSWY